MKMTKLKIAEMILFVVAVMGLVNNPNDGTPESFYAYIISGVCGVLALGIEIFLWIKRRNYKK